MGILKIMVSRGHQDLCALLFKNLEVCRKILMAGPFSIIGQVSTDEEIVRFFLLYFFHENREDFFDVRQILPVSADAVPFKGLSFVIDPGG